VIQFVLGLSTCCATYGYRCEVPESLNEFKLIEMCERLSLARNRRSCTYIYDHSWSFVPERSRKEWS